MKTICITGGAGRVGHKYIEAILKEGHKVICIDALTPFSLIKKERLEPFKSNPNFKLVTRNIIETTEMEKVFNENKIDVVVHLAGRTDNTLLMQRDVLLSAGIMLELAYRAGVKQVFLDNTHVQKSDGMDKPNRVIHNSLRLAITSIAYGYEELGMSVDFIESPTVSPQEVVSYITN